jgi:hypothetical protein
MAAVLIMLSILFMAGVIDVRFKYTTAAIGFLLYVVGVFLTREGKLKPYRIVMVVVAVILIFVSIIREII